MPIDFIGIGSNHTLGLTVKFDKTKYESENNTDSKTETAEEEIVESPDAE